MTEPTEPIVTFSGVSKWFGDIVAVSDVSFSVAPGITALLGPNGAGKSTVLRLMVGLARPSEGEIRVLGRDPRHDLELLRLIGLVPQQEALFERMTALELVTAAATLSKVDRPRERAAHALHLVDLEASDERYVSAYSKGMRQRVKIALALAHDPEVLVLDEPLNGLDPRQRLHLTDLIRRIAAVPGRCVVLSSHVLEEVERFGSRILVIAKGRLAAEGQFRAIRELMDDRPHRLLIVTDHPARLAAGLMGAETVLGARVTATDRVEVETSDVQRFRRTVAAVARDQACDLDEVVPLDDDLDSVFRYLVGR